MKKEKTMHELCKEFPDKTYKELEKHRDVEPKYRKSFVDSSEWPRY